MNVSASVKRSKSSSTNMPRYEANMPIRTLLKNKMKKYGFINKTLQNDFLEI